MKKREACELLGLESIKELAVALGVSYDSLRSTKELSSLHIRFIRHEIDKRFIAEIKNAGDNTMHAAHAHSNLQRKVDEMVDKRAADNKARANDN